MIIRNEIIKNAKKKHKIKMKPKQHLFFPNIVFIEEHTVLEISVITQSIIIKLIQYTVSALTVSVNKIV